MKTFIIATLLICSMCAVAHAYISEEGRLTDTIKVEVVN